MIRLKDELIRCVCCSREFYSGEESLQENVIDSVVDCFSIKIPIGFHLGKCSACPSCVQRLTVANRLKSLIFNSIIKFVNSYSEDKHIPIPSDDLVDVDQMKMSLAVDITENVPCKRELTDDSLESDWTQVKMESECDNRNESDHREGPQSINRDVRVNLVKIDHLYADIPLCHLNNATLHVKLDDIRLARQKEMKTTHTGIPFVFDHLNYTISNVEIDFPSDRQNENEIRNVSNEDQFRSDRSPEDSSIINIECALCAKSFRYKKSLIEHLKRHSENEKHRCIDRSEEFKSKQEPKIHSGGPDRQNFKCEECHRTFKLKNTLIEHSKLHGEVTNFNCTTCPKRFVTEEKLNEHVKGHDAVPRIKCPQCPKMFTRNRNLNEHMRCHSDVRNFKCSACPKSFKHQSNLIQHVKQHSGIGVHRCALCRKEFVSSHEYGRHMAAHGDARDFKCPHCPKAYNLKKYLTHHMKSHGETEKLQCPTCSKPFRSKGGLSTHMLIHSVADTVKCALCSKTFPNKTQLNIHASSHSDERNFECPECHKAFKLKQHLMRHLKMHSAAGIYECTICSKGFKREYYYNSHMKIHQQKDL